VLDHVDDNRHSRKATMFQLERLVCRRQNQGAKPAVADGNPALVTAQRQAHTLAQARRRKLAASVSTEPNSCSSFRQFSALHPPMPIVASTTPVANDAANPTVDKVHANGASCFSTRQRRTNAAPPATIGAAVSIDGCCGARLHPNPFRSNSTWSARLGLPESARVSICASEWSYPLTARAFESFRTAVNTENDRVRCTEVEHRRRSSA